MWSVLTAMQKGNTKEKMKVGIMGGTFNPIHIGHLIIGEITRQEYCLDEIIYIPVGDPPHKPSKEIARAEHRYNMVAKAIEDNSKFRLSDIEIRRTGKTYTIDTLEELNRVYRGDVEFYFIVGGDMLLELKGWKRADELFRKCVFVVYNRWGFSNDKVKKEVENLRRLYAAQILFVHGPLIDISSTYIRDSIKNGISVKYLVPDNVLHYIEENGIYV